MARSIQAIERHTRKKYGNLSRQEVFDAQAALGINQFTGMFLRTEANAAAAGTAGGEGLVSHTLPLRD